MASCSLPSDAIRIEAAFIRHMVFYGNVWAQVLPGIAVDVLQCFPANWLYGGRNRLHVAV